MYLCRKPQHLMKEMGKWEGDVMTNIYAATPNPEVLAMTHGYESREIFPKHALVEPPASIKDKVFPTVLKTNDGAILPVTKALKWAQDKQVHPYSLA